MRKRALGLALAAIAGAVLVSASGAATTRTETFTKIDVSTRGAVMSYLRSIHVNPKGAVIQRGLRNYAGARCPAKGWNCASTKHPVVQIAQRGGHNRFVCRSSSCSVVQLSGVSGGMFIASRPLGLSAPAKGGGGGGNTATCLNPTTGVCTLSQSGPGPNTAVVYENPGKKSGLSQNVSFSASITQQATGATAGNTACVSQVMALDATATAGSGSLAVNLNGHQSLTIKQDVAGSGANSAQYAATSSGTCDTSQPLAQTQTLTSQADAPKGVTQNENATQAACPDGNATPDYANLCLDIEQNQGAGHGVASGTNNANFAQTNTLSAIADSKSGPISQTQSTVNGGLLGTINQDSTGVSTAIATQTENQCEDGAKGGLGSTCHTNDPDAAEAPASLTQVQHGPVKKGLGTATQTSNTGDQYTITQKSTQNTDQGVGSNQTNTLQSDCTTSGTCSSSQQTNENGAMATNTQSGQTIDTTTNCTGSTCTRTLAAPTFTSTPPNPSYSSSASFSFSDTNTSATFLCDIDGSGFSSCSSPATYSGLTNGLHTFSVEATNNGATSGATQYTWMIAPPPTPTITSNPGTTSNSSSASFSFTDTDSTATFECQVDNSGYSPCSSPWTYSNLADGSHTFAVRAEDQTGESGPATFTWTITGGNASANTVDTLNPGSDPGGTCTDSLSSGGFDLTPQKVTDTADLSQYDGQQIELRFSFDTVDNRYNAFEGWYLNNIKVTGTQSNTPVTVFSDAVTPGDTSFTAFGTNGVTPGWHVTANNGAIGTAWWYGNDSTGTYETTSNPIDSCINDGDTNSGTITTPVFTLASGSTLSFDTLWQIEAVNPSTFDLMQVQVIPVTGGPPLQ